MAILSWKVGLGCSGQIPSIVAGLLKCRNQGAGSQLAAE